MTGSLPSSLKENGRRPNVGRDQGQRHRPGTRDLSGLQRAGVAREAVLTSCVVTR